MVPFVYDKGRLCMSIYVCGISVSNSIRITFIERDGQIVIGNASATAILLTQGTFVGGAKDFGISNVDDVQSLVDEVRYEAGK